MNKFYNVFINSDYSMIANYDKLFEYFWDEFEHLTKYFMLFNFMLKKNFLISSTAQLVGAPASDALGS